MPATVDRGMRAGGVIRPMHALLRKEGSDFRRLRLNGVAVDWKHPFPTSVVAFAAFGWPEGAGSVATVTFSLPLHGTADSPR